MFRFLLTVLLFAIIIKKSKCARILGMFPVPSVSHQVVYKEYMQELALKGHDVLTITPNPNVYDKTIKNIEIVDVSFLYKVLEKAHMDPTLRGKRGVIVSENNIMSNMNNFLMHMSFMIFESPQFKQILDYGDKYFDLIILESLTDVTLLLGFFFDAPIILISSHYGFVENHDTTGSISRHPIHYPHSSRQKFIDKDSSFSEKIQQVLIEFKFFNTFLNDDIEDQLIENKFGSNIPTVKELKEKVQLLFLNSHSMFDGNRPVPPNVIYLGALHLLPKKELPKDLETYLNNSKRGVIYVSLGTNVKTSNMDEEFLKEFLNAFEALPYDILWKFDSNNLTSYPENVKIQSWFPQRDLFFHPNVKVFVTQAGIQSIDEAIDAALPMVAIPILGDQFFNAKKLETLGIGLRLDSYTMKADDLINGVNTVFNDKSYKENILQVRTITKDQPQTPKERAVWWTEYVLRNRGAKYLRAMSANVTYYDYFMVDVVTALMLFLVFASIIGSLLVYFSIVFLQRLFIYSQNKIKIK